MKVKIGNTIYDSDKEMIAVMFEGKDNEFKNFNLDFDNFIFHPCPKTLKKNDVIKFMKNIWSKKDIESFLFQNKIYV